MFWEFKNNKNAIETAKKICTVYDQDMMTDYQVQNWFSKFCSGNTSLRDKPRPRYTLDPNQDALRELVEGNPCKVLVN